MKKKAIGISVYPLADISCTKDTGEVFKNTVKPNLAKGINRVHNGKVRFEMNSESKRWKVYMMDCEDADFDSYSDKVIDPEAFMVGDLKIILYDVGQRKL